MPLGEFTDERDLPQKGPQIPGRGAAPGRPVRDVLHDSGAGREAHAAAYDQVVRDPRAAANLGSVADRGRAGDARLPADHHAAADVAVVADLAEVVDLGSLADPRGAELAAIDAGVRADLDVVLDLDRADVRDLHDAPAIRAGPVAEAVGSDHDARGEHHALPEAAALAHHHVRVEHRIVVDLRVGVDPHALEERDARADHGAALDGDERADAHIGAEACGCIDTGEAVDADRREPLGLREALEHGNHGVIRALHAQDRAGRGRGRVELDRLGDDRDGRSTGFEQPGVPAVPDEGEFPRLREVDRREACDRSREVEALRRLDARADQLGQRRDGAVAGAVAVGARVSHPSRPSSPRSSARSALR